MKYLIDKQMYDAIVWMLPDATPIKEMVSKLKPIEPLSVDDVIRIYQSTPATQTSKPGMDVLVFAFAVETHILGDKHDS